MTTNALEAHLPTLMQDATNIHNLRSEYLLMHISERMYWTYDYFLRIKVLERLKKNRFRYGSITAAY